MSQGWSRAGMGSGAGVVLPLKAGGGIHGSQDLASGSVSWTPPWAVSEQWTRRTQSTKTCVLSSSIHFSINCIFAPHRPLRPHSISGRHLRCAVPFPYVLRHVLRPCSTGSVLVCCDVARSREQRVTRSCSLNQPRVFPLTPQCQFLSPPNELSTCRTCRSDEPQKGFRLFFNEIAFSLRYVDLVYAVKLPQIANLQISAF